MQCSRAFTETDIQSDPDMAFGLSVVQLQPNLICTYVNTRVVCSICIMHGHRPTNIDNSDRLSIILRPFYF